MKPSQEERKRTYIPGNILPYYTYCEELYFINGLVLKENQIIIHQTLRQEIENLLHKGHLGIAKIKNCTRETITRPERNNGIENMVRTCEIVNNIRRNKEMELLHLMKYPMHLRQK